MPPNPGSPEPPAGPNQDVEKESSLQELARFVGNYLMEANRTRSAALLIEASKRATNQQLLDMIREACALENLWEIAVRRTAEKYMPLTPGEDGETVARTWEIMPFDQREIVSPIMHETPLENKEFPEDIFGGVADEDKHRPNSVSLASQEIDRLPPIYVSERRSFRIGTLLSVRSGMARVAWLDGGYNDIPVAETLWTLSSKACPTCGMGSKDLMTEKSPGLSAKFYCQNCRHPFRVPVAREEKDMKVKPLDGIPEEYDPWSSPRQYKERAHWGGDKGGEDHASG